MIAINISRQSQKTLIKKIIIKNLNQGQPLPGRFLCIPVIDASALDKHWVCKESHAIIGQRYSQQKKKRNKWISVYQDSRYFITIKKHQMEKIYK